MMRIGKSAPDTLRALLAGDEGRDVRQVAMVDAKGRVAAHTGAKNIAMAGHITGEEFSVQANMMLRDTVWPAMAKAYRETKGDLAERMMAALEAAQAAGGEVLDGPRAMGQGWFACLRDPAGAVFAVFQTAVE